jgi:hypothetical protein
MKWNSFIARVRTLALNASSDDDALRMAIQYGFLRRLNHDGVYEDEVFEAALYKRLSNRLSAPQTHRGGTVLHVLTRPEAGGHTRLALEWLRIRKGVDDQSVIFTRDTDVRTIEALNAAAIPFQLAAGTPMARLVDLSARFCATGTVVLHIHPEDCIAALAARHAREAGTRVLFVNHADHVFSFGTGSADTVLEVSGFGWLTTARKRNAGRQSFLGIPLPIGHCTDDFPAEPDSARRDPGAPVLSVGAPVKYRPAGGISYSAFLNALVEAIPNEIHLVGPNGSEPWWRELGELAQRRIRFLGLRSQEETRRHMRGCIAYVDSFPMTGGTAFQEAFMLGAPSFGLQVGGGGYGLVDALRSASVDDLVISIATAVGNTVTGQDQPGATSLRAQIRSQFSDAAISARMSAAAEGACVPVLSDLLAAAGDLSHFESAWQAGGPALAVVPSEVPGIGLRIRLLAAFAAVARGHIAMSRLKLLRFAFGIGDT